MAQDYDADTLCICIGDDRTDEDMFQMLKGKGLTIKIGAEATHAQYRLKNQTDLNPFLEELINNL
jgi:trehalose 6-phosphate synthase/phosphatase